MRRYENVSSALEGKLYLGETTKKNLHSAQKGPGGGEKIAQPTEEKNIIFPENGSGVVLGHR